MTPVDVDAQPNKLAVTGKAQCHCKLVVARLAIRRDGFAAGRSPFDRTTQPPRGKQRHDKFGISSAAGTKTASGVRRYHAQVFSLQPHDAKQLCLYTRCAPCDPVVSVSRSPSNSASADLGSMKAITTRLLLRVV